MRKIIRYLFAILLLFVILSYAKVEFLTWKYGDQFAELYKMSNMLDNIAYYKVMKYSDEYAEVYYVQGEHLGAELFRFYKENNEWILETWSTIWAKHGSAQDFIWPFYW